MSNHTSQSYLTYIEKGKVNPSIKVISGLAETFNVNLNWLLTGSGNMIIGDNATANRTNILKARDINGHIIFGDNSNIYANQSIRAGTDENLVISLAEKILLTGLQNEIVDLARKANFYPKITLDSLGKQFANRFRSALMTLPRLLFPDALEFLLEYRDEIIKKGLKSHNKAGFVLYLVEKTESKKKELGWDSVNYQQYLTKEFNINTTGELNEEQLYDLYCKIKEIKIDRSRF